MTKDEFFDEELQGMVKFTDATDKESEQSKLGTSTGTQSKSSSVVSKSKQRALKRYIKNILIYVCLSLLVLYWQYSGLMHTLAAAPSLYVLVLLLGMELGRFQKEW